jgi:hypothetical protein
VCRTIKAFADSTFGSTDAAALRGVARRASSD